GGQKENPKNLIRRAARGWRMGGWADEQFPPIRPSAVAVAAHPVVPPILFATLRVIFAFMPRALHLTPAAAESIRLEIARARGNEVCFLARIGDEGDIH